MKTRLSLIGLSSLVLLVAACDDSNGTRGIGSLGLGFLEVFNQDRNAEPIDITDLELAMTPSIEPFNP
ncbi:MAG: hypothetical protein ACJASC_001477 [Limimaricola cinnabarinus]|jgi:hypothetical protein|uniref:Lipoprotein n=1 Tax=Limimaricola cinnabarinus LL-001 TaxID=1337093 RepID=U2Z3R6_9RHOB|nr:hypothetical protein [Limimaricola cinnabarinus]GAD55717.1 hypothetical protein MBELCI_1769 [Limimaricola cinnabarinus LL-001]